MGRVFLIIAILLSSHEVTANFFTCRAGLIEDWVNLNQLERDFLRASRAYERTESKKAAKTYKALQGKKKKAIAKTEQLVSCLLERDLHPNLMKNIQDALYPKHHKRGSFESRVAAFRSWVYSLPRNVKESLKYVLRAGHAYYPFVAAADQTPFRPLVPVRNPRADRALQNFRRAQDRLKYEWQRYQQMRRGDFRRLASRAHQVEERHNDAEDDDEEDEDDD